MVADADTAFHTAQRSYAGTVIEGWIRLAQTADSLARATAAVREIKDAAARAKRAGTTATAIERTLLGTTSSDLGRALAGLRRDLLGM